jgi:hypothetical protein
LKEPDVEQPPQPRSTPPLPPTVPQVSAETGTPRADGAAPADAGLRVCPACSEPRQDDARFCEECGHDFGTDAVPPPATEERSRLSGPVLWLIVVFWAVLAVGGLWFLYTALFSL